MNLSAIEKKNYIIFKCRRCGNLLQANRKTNKTRYCGKCNYQNPLNKVKIIISLTGKKLRELGKGVSEKVALSNLLRYLKIPPDKRGKVPYLDLDGLKGDNEVEFLIHEINKEDNHGKHIY
jgi:hypothetical protein